MRSKFRLSRCVVAAALAVSALGAQAEDKAKAAAAPPSVVQGVRLSTLCAQCGVVTTAKSERRKGDASGMGAVGGAVAGGVVGNKTTDGGAVGTVGGAAVGGLLGNELEKRMKTKRVWTTTVTMKDGSVQKFEAEKDIGFKVGTIVEVGADKQLKKRK